MSSPEETYFPVEELAKAGYEMLTSKEWELAEPHIRAMWEEVAYAIEARRIELVPPPTPSTMPPPKHVMVPEVGVMIVRMVMAITRRRPIIYSESIAEDEKGTLHLTLRCRAGDDITAKVFESRQSLSPAVMQSLHGGVGRAWQFAREDLLRALTTMPAEAFNP